MQLLLRDAALPGQAPAAARGHERRGGRVGWSRAVKRLSACQQHYSRLTLACM
jgi:hypothetical protein